MDAGRRTLAETTGLRPSYGRVSRAGAMSLAWSMDKLGPIARTVEDCALIFDVIHGADFADPTALNAPFAWRPSVDLRGQRIGYVAAQLDQKNEWETTNQAALETLPRLRPSQTTGALKEGVDLQAEHAIYCSRLRVLWKSAGHTTQVGEEHVAREE